MTDRETGAELASSAGGPIQVAVDIAAVRVARSVQLGAEFQYTFDLGDQWVHRCTVGAERVDPLEVLAVRPAAPMACWGWGAMPDQYGRRWADDDGTGPPPDRPAVAHPMPRDDWPAPQARRDLNIIKVRAAVAGNDTTGFLDVVDGVDVDDALQQVGAGVAMLLAAGDGRAETLAVSVINRLTLRGWEGDDVLAEDLLAVLRRSSLPGRAVPVDLDMFSSQREGDTALSTGGYLDLRSGEVIDDVLTDPDMVGDDAAVDVADDPNRWLRVERAGSRNGWHDMAAFAARQTDAALRERLQHAIEGTGAFRRFRGLIDDEGLADVWRTFSTDRQLGRARAFLAAHNIRVSPGKAT